MEFSCRICKDKFSVTKVLSSSAVVSEGFSVVSTQCGHLFHWKCLEGALTNQKLLHARHGTGPLRRFCPVVRCNANIPSDDSIIKICFNDDIHTDKDDNEETNCQDTESKLVKRVQTLMAERDRLAESLEKSETETEVYRSAFERVKFDLADVQSFLKDDYQMRKGDLIFWVTRDGTLAPGKVLEIRKKPGENIHYAIVKLDNKTKVPGVGPYAVNRDTLILPVSDLITFKSFFSGFFDTFQAAFEALRVDLNSEIQDISSPTGSHSSTERNAAYYRSTRKISRSTSKSSTGASTLNPLDELDSESFESVPVVLSKNSATKNQNSKKIIRSKTIHYGAGKEPRRMEKCRSMSWVTPPTSLMDSPTASESSRIEDSFLEESSSNSQLDINDSEEDTSEFIREGERVIWFDTYSEYQQLGTVAAVCEYSPCAIVKFDEHPIVKYKFQYRTIQLDELFPYDLASPEDKFKIAESYGKVADFVDNRKHLFSISNEDASSEGENEKEEN